MFKNDLIALQKKANPRKDILPIVVDYSLQNLLTILPQARYKI